MVQNSTRLHGLGSSRYAKLLRVPRADLSRFQWICFGPAAGRWRLYHPGHSQNAARTYSFFRTQTVGDGPVQLSRSNLDQRNDLARSKLPCMVQRQQNWASELSLAGK